MRKVYKVFSAKYIMVTKKAKQKEGREEDSTKEDCFLGVLLKSQKFYGKKKGEYFTCGKDCPCKDWGLPNE